MWREASEAGFQGNPFVFPIQMLREQYRCPEVCYKSSNQRLYGGMVKTVWDEKKRLPIGYPFADPLLGDKKGETLHLSWLNTKDYPALKSGTSWYSA
ncbi:MAG: hypothetical protein AAFU83_01645 [Bacteroidota bacterium]